MRLYLHCFSHKLIAVLFEESSLFSLSLLHLGQSFAQSFHLGSEVANSHLFRRYILEKVVAFCSDIEKLLLRGIKRFFGEEIGFLRLLIFLQREKRKAWADSGGERQRSKNGTHLFRFFNSFLELQVLGFWREKWEKRWEKQLRKLFACSGSSVSSFARKVFMKNRLPSPLTELWYWERRKSNWPAGFAWGALSCCWPAALLLKKLARKPDMVRGKKIGVWGRDGIRSGAYQLKNFYSKKYINLKYIIMCEMMVFLRSRLSLASSQKWSTLCSKQFCCH